MLMDRWIPTIISIVGSATDDCLVLILDRNALNRNTVLPLHGFIVLSFITQSHLFLEQSKTISEHIID